MSWMNVFTIFKKITDQTSLLFILMWHLALIWLFNNIHYVALLQVTISIENDTCNLASSTFCPLCMASSFSLGCTLFPDPFRLLLMVARRVTWRITSLEWAWWYGAAGLLIDGSTVRWLSSANVVVSDFAISDEEFNSVY